MDDSTYQHLTIPISDKTEDLLLNTGFPRTKKMNLYIFLKYLLFNPIMLKLANRIKSYERFVQRKQVTLDSYNGMEQFRGDPQDYDSPYGYEELKELETVYKYQMQIRKNFPDPSESKGLYEHAERVLTDLLKENKVTHFVNFGVAYAYLGSLLAAKFSKIQFIGIDRSIFTKRYNEQCFAEYSNLEFIAGDIFDLLEERQFTGGVFFHTRIMNILPKSFVVQLYEAVAKGGFEHIVLMEQAGISRQTLQAYQYSENDQACVAYRDGMILHNHPWLLKKAGYSIIRSELVKTDHPHDDFRFVSVTANLSGNQRDILKK